MSTPRPTSAPQIDRPLAGIILVVVLGSIMSILDSTIVNVAIDPLAQSFRSPLSTMQWVSTGYLLALGAVIPLTGWAADRFGTRRLYLVSLVLFTAGSLLAGLAWSAESLIIFRILQGLGGGMLMPAGMTMITRAAGPERLGRVMSLVGVPMLLGPIAGPILGGILIDLASWRWIFFVNLPIGIIAVLLGMRLLPPDRPEPSQTLDWAGALLLSPSIALLIFGLSGTETGSGIASPAAWVPAAAGALLLLAFIVHSFRTASPLIDLRLLGRGAMGPAVVTAFLISVAFTGVMYVLPLYFQQVRGLPAILTGLLITPLGIGATVMMQIVGRIAHRVRSRTIVLIGLVPFLIGFLCLTLLHADTPLWAVILLTLLLGLGAGATQMPIMTAGLETLEHRDSARANTVFNILLRVGGSLSVTLYTLLLAANAGNMAEAAPIAAFGSVFWMPVLAVIAAGIGAALLPLPRRQTGASTAAPPPEKPLSR